VTFRSDRQPRLFLLSLAGAFVLGAVAWIVTGLWIAAVLAGLGGFCLVTFGIGGFHADDSSERLREEKRGVRARWSWWS
jgi:hypothetical protein